MFKILLKSLISGFGFTIAILISLVSYGAWTNLGTVSSGDLLSSSTWNTLITKVNDIGARTDAATGFKNYIMNGGFDVWQRGTSFNSSSMTWTYGADRFRCTARDGVATYSRYELANNELAGSTYALKFSQTSPTTGTNTPAIYQGIENTKKMIGKTFTYSFYAKASKNISIIPYYSAVWANADNYVFLSTQNITTNRTKYSVTFTVSQPTGVYNASTDNFYMTMKFPAQDTFDFYISQVQLEEGPVATAFEQRSYGLELSLCQRYYEKSYDISTIPGTISGNGAIRAYWTYLDGTSEIFNSNVYYKVPKRIVPNVIFYSPRTGSSGKIDLDGTNDRSYSSPLNSGQLGFSVTFNGNYAIQGNLGQYHWVADAEL